MSEVIKLKHVARVRPSNVNKKTADGERGVRLCNYTDVYYNDVIRGDLEFMSASATPDQVRQFELRAGDVLITKDSETADDIAIPAFIAEDLPGVLCGYHLSLVRPQRDRIDPKFLFWCMASSMVRSQAESYAAGITRVGIRSELVGSLLIPYLPIERQRGIASYLDVETFRIDALIASKQQLAELSSERLAAEVDSQTFPAPRPPLLALRRVAKFIDYRGATPQKSTEGVPLITASHVRGGRLVLDLEPQFLSEDDYDAWMRRGLPRVGDVVMTTEAPLGEVGQVEDEHVALAQRVVLMRSDKTRMTADYLAFTLRSPSFQGSLSANATGSTARGIKVERLKALQIPVRPLEDQLDVVAYLQAQTRRHTSVVTSLSRQVALLTEHRKALITAAVTGEIHIPEAVA